MITETFIIVIWGVFAAFLQERFGKFQDLSPKTKQLINAVLTVVIPAAAAYLAPYWRPEFGDPTKVLTGGVIVLMPMIAWLASQVGHQIDRLLQKYGG